MHIKIIKILYYYLTQKNLKTFGINYKYFLGSFSYNFKALHKQSLDFS